ncbi:SrtC, putative [Microscilla marina ATCC 23134]|uniref:SrtC, putative n=2 Tax=Microscilla marina TaxID=1027 RepID=A1ZZX7_MICM2|nr:SrtC, putative [Microscilla marina ATCC 23134]
MDREWDFKEASSLYTGVTGMAIHYALLYQHTKQNEYREYTYNLVSEALNNVTSLSYSSSLSGISGVAWMLQYLVDIRFFENEEVEEYLPKLKKAILATIEQDKKRGNYDLMHGLIGKMIVLLDIQNFNPSRHPDIMPVITDSINYLHQTSIQNKADNTTYWMAPFRDHVITGMAHGVSSIIWYLAKVIETDIVSTSVKQTANSLIISASNWLLMQKITTRDSKLLFPTKVFIGNQEGKKKNFSLAWCHGDLGIAIALIKSGKALNDSRLLNEGIQIAETLAQIKKQDSTIIQDAHSTDACFCHGTFGLFFIFYILYKRTGSNKLKTAYSYWLELINNSLQNSSDIGLPYGILEKDKSIRWLHDPGILIGATGQALVLHTYYLYETSKELDSEWFKLFL